MNPRDNVRAITQDRGVALASKNFEVNAPATVQARQTDSSGVLRAVNGFAQAYSEKRSKEAAEAVEEARAQGFLDESIGRVDESKIGTVDGYGEGVTARRTEAIGLRTVNAALQELDTAINDPEFDFETFRQDKLREMVEMSPEGQSPAARLQMAKVASQFDQNLRGKYEALAARKRLEDGQRSLAENFSAFLDSGMQSGEQVTQWMATRGAESGFDDDEVKAVAGTILLSRLGMGDTKAYAMAEEAGLLVNPEMQAKFFQASQIAEAKAESARMDALKADVEGRTEAMMDIQRRLRAGTLDPAYALKIAERRPDLQGFVESALVQSVGIEIQRAEAAAQAAQAAERAGQLRALVAGGDRRAVLAAQLAGVTDKELKDTATSMVRESWLQSLSEDPEVQAAGRANIRFTVESLASAGLESPEVKRLFNSADPSNAAEFAQKVEIYRELEATPMRDYVRQQMDATTRASFDRYTSLVSAGKTPSQAAQEVATRRIAPEVVERNFSQVLRERQYDRGLTDITSELGIDGGFAPTIQAEYEAKVKAELMYAASPTEAVDRAVEQMTQDYIVVGGTPVKRGGWVDDEFVDRWELYSEKVLKPDLVKRFGEDFDDDIGIAPIPNSPNREFFLTHSNGNFVEALNPETGRYEAVILSAREVAEKAGVLNTASARGVRQAQARAAQGAAAYDPAYDPNINPQ